MIHSLIFKKYYKAQLLEQMSRQKKLLEQMTVQYKHK
jgi:hypothetical protein